MTTGTDLKTLEGKTFRRGTETCDIQNVHSNDCYVTVKWHHHDQSDWQQVPKSMLQLWLNDAVEVAATSAKEQPPTTYTEHLIGTVIEHGGERFRCEEIVNGQAVFYQISGAKLNNPHGYKMELRMVYGSPPTNGGTP